MKLIDFHENEAFNDLRKHMGQEELGEFELFDPSRHLSWQERQQLEKGWITVKANELHSMTKKLLAYKNSTVITKVEGQYHFALCDKLVTSIQKGKLSSSEITVDGNLIRSLKVCEFCLHAVSYQGFDAYRHRHQEYNDKIINNFKLDDVYK